MPRNSIDEGAGKPPKRVHSCSEFHESPHNLGGWAIAGVAVAIAATAAVALRRESWIPTVLVVVVLILQVAALGFLILPTGSCGTV